MSDQRGSRPAATRRLAGIGVGPLLAMTIGVLLVLAVLGIGLALLANGRLTHNRNVLLNQVGPARRAALSLETALVNEETGVRGYVITADKRSLQPYEQGQSEAVKAYRLLVEQEHVVGPQLTAELAAVRERGLAWQQQFVAPALANPKLAARQAIGTGLEGKRQFDALRVSLSDLREVLEHSDTRAREALQSAADELELLLIVAGLLILGGVLAAGFVLRRTITLPLASLGAEARRVAGGEFSTPLKIADGPREVAEMGAEIDAMRERIVEELASVEAGRERLESQALELTRSNAELEQFAYVASHDLQEPLRKVASFCQALQQRYGDQLDARAEQYIEFAVDGAKRMQVLINDLLAFSRVGRSGREPEPVALGEVVAAAESSVADQLRSYDGRVLVGELPIVSGDRAQLVSLFQNLISNALKFHGEQLPLVQIDARRSGEMWEIAVADNGIGIERDYVERIFMIFQRLHSREAYEGTGIGLALARKIVEYHGGEIWLDPDYSGGACFRFTFPIIEETQQ
ncbi:MAG TPA: ATP-binding protein [Solirubrobacteraceae bacterium]|nr:ATP-binding protein [Solirubrobacteraceae bacterium]